MANLILNESQTARPLTRKFQIMKILDDRKRTKDWMNEWMSFMNEDVKRKPIAGSDCKMHVNEFPIFFTRKSTATKITKCWDSFDV